MNPIRISAVSYLNTKPFIYGLYKGMPPGAFELSLDIPSECARKLHAGEVELALMPVGAIPDLQAVQLVSDYCIGSEGRVKTVCLYAEKPVEDIRRVLLDFHSRTSTELIKILFREYWRLDVVFEPAQPGFERQIASETAGLVIGDRTMGLDRRFPFVYDLGELWTAHTGLPFVFAAWFSREPLPSAFIGQFNEALRTGLEHLPELIKILPEIPGFDTEAYFRENISYNLDEAKWQGLNRFLSMLENKPGARIFRQALPLEH